MAEGGVPIPFDSNTPDVSGPSEPKKLQLELIDGFYKFRAMDEMNSKTKQFANFWIHCYNRWEKIEALLGAGYSFEEVRNVLNIIYVNHL